MLRSLSLKKPNDDFDRFATEICNNLSMESDVGWWPVCKKQSRTSSVSSCLAVAHLYKARLAPSSRPLGGQKRNGQSITSEQGYGQEVVWLHKLKPSHLEILPAPFMLRPKGTAKWPKLHAKWAATHKVFKCKNAFTKKYPAAAKQITSRRELEVGQISRSFSH